MQYYYVNDDPTANGSHEVHRANCNLFYKLVRKTSLGLHNDCKPALAKAKQIYMKANGCKECCPKCHR